MTRLTSGVYGHEFDSKIGPFDLFCGQTRRDSLVHNGGWYNKYGEKLGWGDLNKKDLHRIKNNLQDDELFIILGERDSFWNFVEHLGTIGAMCKTNEKEQNPGVQYVAEKARYVIAKGKLMIHEDNYLSTLDWDKINTKQLLEIMK
ncbi:MAG: hypothetical protein DWQ19_09090 [Crenarchaeota archaeon]|nr:MAG: hypothetical protein DWQ19_09090 [Thermoproteota archaeon]